MPTTGAWAATRNVKTGAPARSAATTSATGYSYTGLSAAQVDRLREQHGVYMVRSGRICVAGLNTTNVEPAAAAMAAVMATGR